MVLTIEFGVREGGNAIAALRRMGRPPSGFSGVSLVKVASVALALFAGSAAGGEAGESGPVLVVPGSQVELEVAPAMAGAMASGIAGGGQLVEIDNADLVVPVQLGTAIAPDGTPAEGDRRLIAAIAPRKGAGGPRRFRLQAAKGKPPGGAGFRFEEVNDKSVKLWEGESPVLVYNHGVITKDSVPEGDPRRSRACYVHPVWGLNGEILTDDFPRDHYHHHGVFWTWPHVKIEDREYDLWADRGIKQRFVRWLARETGPVAAVIGVENGWFVEQQQVMVERVWIRVYKAAEATRSIDLEFAWIPMEKPVTLWGAPNKSYGGLTVRFAPPSSRDPNTLITVPTGPTTADLPETRLAWADFTSKFGDAPARSGAAVFVAPNHPDFPPTWLTRHYGPLCVGWPGVKSRTFEPGRPIRLDYRFWIHKGPVETAEIQRAYEAYGASMNAEWE